MESCAAIPRTVSSTSSSSYFFSVSRNPNSPSFKLLNYCHSHIRSRSSPVFESIKCIQPPMPDPVPQRRSSNVSPFLSSAVTLSPFETADTVACKLQNLILEFQPITESIERVKRLLRYATLLPPFPDSARVDSNRVMGCTARVWLEAELDGEGRMRFAADSDSEITRGYCACLVMLLDGAAPEEVLSLRTEDLAALKVGLSGSERSRINTWQNLLVSMQKRTKGLVAKRQGRPSFEPFPSLVISADGIKAQGSYAEAQARYLFPDESKVEELVKVLKEKKIGVVAHFYMDPEVQGVLTAAKKQWPHIHISDSLVMADRAVDMAKAGCQFINVLGVDFMSENVRAILDQAGFGEVGVYRMSNERIGCSLADAAATTEYMNYLEEASGSSPSLHVIYINTALDTKAFAHEIVPTITCTSSNVVQTILQAFAQIPDLSLWYGPDSYMGANIANIFEQMAMMTDEEVAEIHPKHNRDSIRSLLPRLHYFQNGTCIVHHLFGHEVVKKIEDMYCDAYLTAHLEVPGEMFSLAMEARRRGMGVVGSTSNILDFIKERVKEALDRNVDDHLQFVLGTESGMVTSIVAAVRDMLSSARSSSRGANVNVEIVFPVSSDSITGTATNSAPALKSVAIGDLVLPVVPGVASGEGCSIHGGCASCPYMKMNSLSSLLKVCHRLPDEQNLISAYKAEKFKLQTPNGKSVAEVGCEPILHMRHFQSTKELPDQLVHQVLHLSEDGSSVS
ncbi:quinolinate synthase chloroplastic [Tripterygium wilfordii]|uniref:Quinolinate synthase, chloroplastic n=1 Tax=Tripterygium wilfordii TaxID=458696 RepID=A0A7J7DBT1_TRIWF|nr:quinolinate synthase, chloroplastic-like [Tripterygium wilfordii]KAF5743718.1 quinolinate synthase chloroplastic [Tripterygium wilfordii]